MEPETADTKRSVSEQKRWLEQLRAETRQHRATWYAREAGWSWARLGFFAAIILPWLFLSAQPGWAGILSLVALILFVIVICRHLRAQAARQAADRLLTVIDETGQRQGGPVVCIRAWDRPADNAAEDQVLPLPFERDMVWELSPQERDDLDLFSAPVGIFGLLNRTSSAVGARRLRDMLEKPSLVVPCIQARQAMVSWLEEHSSARLRLMAALAALRGEDQRLSRLVQAIKGVMPLELPLPTGLLRLWSLITMHFMFFCVWRSVAGDLVWGSGLLALFVLNGILFMTVRQRVTTALKPWEDVAWAARAGQIAARQASEDLPNETGLGRLRDTCAAISRRHVLPRLMKRAGWTDRGGLLYELFNVLLLADVHVAHVILKCAVGQRDTLLAGISALAELEALCSLGAFAWEQPQKCYPEVLEDTAVRITAGFHPLLDPEMVVPNDVELTPATRMWIVTGSNMAGKSTFLRMVGVNVLLAQIGSAVTARRMSWSPLRIQSDLRARDSLAEGESYFLAEVRHLRRMVLPPSGDIPLLGLIDEPFRGTNSQDQTAASLAVLKHLLASPNVFLVATHDRHLTKLGEGAGARNVHFREDLSSAALVFDYHLHAGPAQTRNALRVLEREGYPATLVADAIAWLEQTDAEDD
ncbi:MAG: hypothetical protein ABIG44_07610 [Planctomycetota bacterium]